jgi:dTDP-glucose 4,6-dehydratase
MRSFLVTGGAGFMGRDFIRLLLEKKEVEKVVCLDAMTYAGRKENIQQFFSDSRFVFIQGNILDQQLVEKILREEKIDCLVHYAAESHVDRSIENPLAFVQTNVLGTVSLLEAVKRFPNVWFHHVSTDEVYGSLGKEGIFYENSPYQPNSPYSASKASSDHFVFAYGKTFGLNVTISHASNNFGPYQFEEKLIPKLIHHLIEKKPFPLYGDGTNVREWTYVEDHSRAIYLLLERGKKNEIYNIGSGQEKSNLALISVLIEIFAKKTAENKEGLFNLIQFVEDRKGHDFRYSMQCEKIKKLGFECPMNFEERMATTIDFYLKKLEVLK